MAELMNKMNDEEINEKIALEDALWDAYNYLTVCKNYIDEMIDLQQENEYCKEKFNIIKNKNIGASIFLDKVRAIPMYFALFILAIALPGFWTKICIIATIVLMMFISRRKIKNNKEKPEREAMEYWNSTGAPTCEENNKKIQKIEQELRTYVEGNKKKVEFLPLNIRYDYNAVSYIEAAIRNGKADTIKEAMQLYDNHLYQLKLQATMENMANSMYAHNQAMEAYMSDVVEQQKIANSKLSDIENWTFLDYMNSKYGY